MNSPHSAISAVADAGPLIALGRLNLLGLLPELVVRTEVPQAVLAECMAQPALPDAQRIQHACTAGQLLVCEAKPIGAGHLGPGERNAIGRAIEVGAVLLADDLAARRHAQSLGLVVIGTLGVRVRARRVGLVPAIAAPIEQLRRSGYWIADATVAAALAATGEQES